MCYVSLGKLDLPRFSAFTIFSGSGLCLVCVVAKLGLISSLVPLTDRDNIALFLPFLFGI